jgi:hypothetical protein
VAGGRERPRLSQSGASPCPVASFAVVLAKSAAAADDGLAAATALIMVVAARVATSPMP